MGSETKNPPNREILACRPETQFGGSDANQHPERVARLGEGKKRSREMGKFILQASAEAQTSVEGEKLYRLGGEVISCANYLVFNNYYTVGQIKLSKIMTCKKHMLCPVCARIRAAKQVSKYLERLDVIKEQKPVRLALLTLTVKNGDDLEERFHHLQKSFKTYQKKRRDWISKGTGFNELAKVDGAVFSYEITKKDNGWHPHIHAIVDLNEWIDQDKLINEWQAITGDSFICDIRRIKNDPAKGFLEVFKYALKFSEMSLGDNLDAYETLRTRRLQGSFGTFHGVKVPEKMTDDLLDDLPFLELFYHYAKEKGVYDLKECRTHTSLEQAANGANGVTAEAADQGPSERKTVISKVHQFDEKPEKRSSL